MTHRSSTWLILLAMATSLASAPAFGQSPDKTRLFILSGQSNMSFNPEKDFAQHLRPAFPGEKIVVVTHAIGGQGIWFWLKDWKVEGAPLAGLPEKLGETYDALLKKVAASGVDMKSAASVSLIWMQGETDARNERACHVYGQSLRGLIQQFRRDLGREDLRVVIGRINDAQMKRESWQIVRAAQVAAAKADPLATWIDSDDLNGDDNNVHNNAAGKQELGRRFAQAAAAQWMDKVRVLFVANSYSLWNHLPRLLEEFIRVGQKREAEVMPFTSAGAPLSWHLNDGRAMKWLTGNTQGFVAGAEERVRKLQQRIAEDPAKGEAFVGPAKITLKDELREKEVELARAKDGRWNFVFLLFFTDDYDADDAEITRRVKTFADAARKHNVQPIVWLPWGGSEDLKRYAAMAGKLDVPLVPTSFGEQLHKSGKLTEKTSLRWGGGHPNARVTYLYACMFYGAMFNVSPEGLPIYKLRGFSAKEENIELTQEEAIQIQKAAWEALKRYRELKAAAEGP